ncbi:MAG TPA: hypothetical protein VFM49_25125, partial [Chloroflexia bacterium]|nr:hypothetical protein [Chloroflexia bacterium]
EEGPLLDEQRQQFGVDLAQDAPGLAAARLVEAAVRLPPVEALLNGLIANDKICFVRFARLARERARPSSPRGPRRPPAPGYPSDDGDRQGGGDEAGVAHPTGGAGGAGRATALGPRLPGALELGVPGQYRRAGAGGRARGEGGG